MQASLTLAEFDAGGEAFDHAVVATPGIVPYCSCGDWILAAHLQLMVERELRVLRDGENWLVTARQPDRDLWQPLEASWCFGCSLIGPDPVSSVRFLAQIMASDSLDGRPVWISGIRRGSELERELAALQGSDIDIRPLPAPMNVVTADLSHGMHGYLANRGANFRRNVRRAVKRATADGIVFVDAGAETHMEIVARILAIDRRSYKYAEGKSIFSDPAHLAFYTELLRRAASHSRLLAMFAQRDDRDVGYYVGARLADNFRGFQMGYAGEFADIGVGNALHLKVVERLCEWGIAQYDLGMAIGYKERWVDDVVELVTVLVQRGD